jgi:small subunit ribosomal protein S14
MKKKVQKDKKIRLNYKNMELKHHVLKSIIKNENLVFLMKWNAILKLSNLPKNSSKVRLVNRCVLTSRKAKFTRIYKKFSRLSFLRLVRFGHLSGVQKSSW